MRFWRVARGDRGSALIELAVSLPLLIAILAATIDFARVFYTGVALSNAARAGAQYGAHSLGRSGGTANMQTAAVNSVSPDLSGVTATASRTCQCATNAGVFSATTPTANDCSSPVSSSCPTGHLVVTVTVTASRMFTTVMNYLPGVPSSMTLTRSATLRVAN